MDNRAQKENKMKNKAEKQSEKVKKTDSSVSSESKSNQKAAAKRLSAFRFRMQKKQAKAHEKIMALMLKGEILNNRRTKKEMRGNFSAAEYEIKNRLLQIAEQQNPDAEWVNLDNAAMIFPSTDSPDINGMFRLSATLNKEVDPFVLQEALNSTIKRFPTISGSIKTGVFWYYLEPSINPVVVEEERLFPCTRIPMDSRHSCIRVVYFKYRISVDFFHAVADGNSGLVFLNTLVGAYLRLKGLKIEGGQNYLDDRDKPKKEEAVDSFLQMADLKTPNVHKDVVAYPIEGERLANFSLVVINGTMDSDELNRVAKSFGATIGQYLTAAIIWAIEEDRRFFGYSKKRPVVVSVPANLRKFYPSPTLRNFISVMTIKGNGTTDFKSILQAAKQQFDEKNKMEYFMGVINFNVRCQKNVFLKICPLFLKNIVLKIAFNIMGTKAHTTTLSNLGVVKVPKQFSDEVCRYEFILGPQKKEMISFSCCSFNGKTVISCSRTIKESNVIRLFFKKLSDDGISVCVDTNCEV